MKIETRYDIRRRFYEDWAQTHPDSRHYWRDLNMENLKTAMRLVGYHRDDDDPENRAPRFLRMDGENFSEAEMDEGILWLDGLIGDRMNEIESHRDQAEAGGPGALALFEMNFEAALEAYRLRVRWHNAFVALRREILFEKAKTRREILMRKRDSSKINA